MMTKAIAVPGGRSAEAPALKVTPAGVTISTVVPVAMPGPKTVMPALRPVVSLRLGALPPALHTALVAATTGATGQLKTSRDEAVTAPVVGSLSVTVSPSTDLTVVPGAMPGPLTGMPTPMPVAGLMVSCVVPAEASVVGLAANGGIMNP